MQDLIKVPTVSIKPSHITFYYDCPNLKKKKPSHAVEKIMPKNNKAGLELSDKATKRLKNGINWLLELAEQKVIFNNKTRSHFSFKVNLITLTLPSLQAHFDTTIKTVCFNNFLTELRKYHGLKNYVWRAELQDNGNIHFHIATDTFFHWGIIRRIWNRLLKKLGYISRYQKRFKGLSFKEYCRIVDPKKKADISRLLTRYEYGNKTNWLDPNTTDIHSLQKVKNVAAYLSKYLSKKSNSKNKPTQAVEKIRRIKGRQWGQSQSLSKCKSIIMDVSSIIEDIVDYSEKNLKPKWIDDLYYNVLCVRMSDWSNRFKDFYDRIISQLKKDIGFSPGKLAKSVVVN